MDVPDVVTGLNHIDTKVLDWSALAHTIRIDVLFYDVADLQLYFFDYLTHRDSRATDLERLIRLGNHINAFADSQSLLTLIHQALQVPPFFYLAVINDLLRLYRHGNIVRRCLCSARLLTYAVPEPQRNQYHHKHGDNDNKDFLIRIRVGFFWHSSPLTNR